MNYLQIAAKNTLKAVKENRLKFFILILLQLLFLGALFWSGIMYQVKLFQDIQSISEPLQRANFDEASLQQGQMFTNEMYTIFLSYQSLMKHLWEFAGIIGIIFLILGGAIWVLTNNLLNKDSEKSLGKRILQSWLKYLVSSVVLFLPIALAGYFIFKLLFSLGLSETALANLIGGIVIAFIIGYYFLLVSFALINTSSWRNFLKEFLKVSIKRIHYTLLLLLVNIIILLIGVILIYFTLSETLFPLLLLASILFLLLIIIVRIFFVFGVQEILKK